MARRVPAHKGTMHSRPGRRTVGRLPYGATTGVRVAIRSAARE